MAPVLGLLGSPGRDVVHQARREAVIRFQTEGPELLSNAIHECRINTTFNRRRYERGELRSRPAAFLETFGVDEDETLEGMVALDRTVHVNAALFAGVELN